MIDLYRNYISIKNCKHMLITFREKTYSTSIFFWKDAHEKGMVDIRLELTGKLKL